MNEATPRRRVPPSGKTMRGGEARSRSGTAQPPRERAAEEPIFARKLEGPLILEGDRGSPPYWDDQQQPPSLPLPRPPMRGRGRHGPARQRGEGSRDGAWPVMQARRGVTGGLRAAVSEPGPGPPVARAGARDWSAVRRARGDPRAQGGPLPGQGGCRHHPPPLSPSRDQATSFSSSSRSPAKSLCR